MSGVSVVIAEDSLPRNISDGNTTGFMDTSESFVIRVIADGVDEQWVRVSKEFVENLLELKKINIDLGLLNE